MPAIAERLARQHGATVKKSWGYAIKGFFAVMNEAHAEAMSRQPDVAFVEENAELFLSATVPTHVDPSCSPSPGVACMTDDNRLWHLDMMDQNTAVGSGDYSYCTDGSNVYVYVIDTGVMRAHREFGNDPNRVLGGYDASGDPSWFPAWDPCHGTANSEMRRQSEVAGNHGHGTGVGSLVAGQTVGIARSAKIVPVKVWPCMTDGARAVIQNRSFVLNEIVYANSAYYRVVTAGTATGPAPGFWCWSDSPPGCVTTWGTLQLEFVSRGQSLPTVQMLVDGLDWIVRPSQPDANGNVPIGGFGSPYPKSPAVVTLSTFRKLSDVNTTELQSIEQAIANLLNYNGGGITVIASANNQGANACDTTPARIAQVVTVGGTMLRNNPDPNPIDGSVTDPSKPTVFERWQCGPGDSDDCNAEIGSNGGGCVTLFAPAKNIPVANIAATDGYRNPRVKGVTGTASGTSWSAPIVAGMAARILQSNPTYTALQVRNALLAHTRPDLYPQTLDPPNVTGTPNAVLQLTDVSVNDLPATIQAPASGSTSITATASGTGALTYELFQVDARFNPSVEGRRNAAATRIAGPQPSNTFSVQPPADTSYFVRVRSNCSSADSSITTVLAGTPPAAPANFVATRTSASNVSFTWSTVSDANGYRVEQKLPATAWTTAVTVSSGSTSFANAAPPSTPGGVVLYRIIATKGGVDSPPSNVDVAWVGTFDDDPIVTASTLVRGIQLVQLRRAVNSLCDIAGVAQPFTAAQIADNALTGALVDDAHFTDLLSRLNAVRANLGMPAIAFTTPMTAGRFILATDLNDLRNGLK